jgi:hypothetical protein
MFKVPVPAIVVVPLPLIVPPVQLIVVTVTLSDPASVPLNVIDAGVLSAVPLLKFAVPLMVSGPVNPDKFAPAAKVTVPASVIVPAPLKLPLTVMEPSTLSVDPVAALKLPLLLPPVARFNVPVCTATVPLFVRVPKKLMGEVPLPADFFSVPAFVNVEATPPRLPSP